MTMAFLTIIGKTLNFCFQLNKEEALQVLPHKKKQASLEEEYEVENACFILEFYDLLGR